MDKFIKTCMIKKKKVKFWLTMFQIGEKVSSQKARTGFDSVKESRGLSNHERVLEFSICPPVGKSFGIFTAVCKNLDETLCQRRKT